MKKYCTILLLFLCLSNAVALDYGIDSSSKISLYENKSLSEISFNFYLGNTFSFDFGEVVLHPQISYEDNKFSFNFEEFSAHLYLTSSVLELGKYKIYYGEGVGFNILFPFVPVPTEDGALKQWNFKYFISLSNISVLLGCIFDTVQIDNFKCPNYFIPYLLIEYQKENLRLSFSSDYFYSDKEQYVLNNQFNAYKSKLVNSDMKSVVEVFYILPKDYNIYGQLGYFYNFSDKNEIFDYSNLMILSGLSKNCSLNEEIFLSPYIEFGLGDGKFLLDCGAICDLNSEYTVVTNIKFINDSLLRIYCSLSYSHNDYSFYVSYGTPNLIRQEGEYNKNHLLELGFKFEK